MLCKLDIVQIPTEARHVCLAVCAQVQQSVMVVPMEQMPSQLIHLLAQHRASDPTHKVFNNATLP